MYIDVLYLWDCAQISSNATIQKARLSQSASCLPACRSDTSACIFPSSASLMSDYHSCSCSSFFFIYYEDKCVTHSVITPSSSFSSTPFFFFLCFITYSVPPSWDLSSLSKSGASVRELAVRRELFSSAVKFPSLSGSCFNQLGNIAARHGSWLGLVPVA